MAQVNVDIGGQASFACTVTKEMRWYHEVSRFLPLSLPIAYVQQVIEIKSVKLSDSGNYFCYGKQPSNDRHFLARAQLIVYGKLFSLW